MTARTRRSATNCPTCCTTVSSVSARAVVHRARRRMRRIVATSSSCCAAFAVPSWRSTPRVDIAYIVGALPKAPARATVAARARARSAVGRLARRGRGHGARRRRKLGGGSQSRAGDADVDVVGALGCRSPTRQPRLRPRRSTSRRPSASAKSRRSRARRSRPTDDQDATTDAGPDGRFGGLSDAQLKALLGEIERLEAVPITEPEPVTIKVNVGTPHRRCRRSPR